MVKKTIDVLQVEVPVTSYIETSEGFQLKDLSLIEQELDAKLTRIGNFYGTGYDGNRLDIRFYSGKSSTSVEGTAVKKKLLYQTSNALLININEATSDRVEPIYTFGTPIVFTTDGFQPRVYVYQFELLINKLNSDSRNKFMELYEKYGRASSALIGPERKEAPITVSLSYRNRYVDGVFLSMDMVASADRPHSASVTLSMFVYDEGFSIINEDL